VCGEIALRFAATTTGYFNRIALLSRRNLCLSIFVASLIPFALLGCAADYHQKGTQTLQSKLDIPLPTQALLKPQPEPICGLEASQRANDPDRAQGTPAPTRAANPPAHERSHRSDASVDPTPASGIASQKEVTVIETGSVESLTLRVKLEYERNCFQRAEEHVREKLQRLQTEVATTIRAIKRSN
jgi:hypothetical protein